MAEIKFSCPQCGQHISGNEQWSGHQIQCPTCATTLTVPQALPPPAAVAPVPKSLVPQPPVSHGAKLSAGATQVARSTAPGPIPVRQPAARPPRNKSPLLKYAVYAIVLAVLGGAGYIFLPSLLSNIQDSGNSKPTQTPAYIPAPRPVKTQISGRAHNCPLWEADNPEMWNQVLKHPERTPALGFYAQGNPEVSDWETKWAVEHGVSFFIYCWYRTSQGGPVRRSSAAPAIEALFKSRFVDKMKFTIMWENQTAAAHGEPVSAMRMTC